MRAICVFEKDGVHLYRAAQLECEHCYLRFDDMGEDDGEEKEEEPCTEPSS